MYWLQFKSNFLRVNINFKILLIKVDNQKKLYRLVIINKAMNKIYKKFEQFNLINDLLNL